DKLYRLVKSGVITQAATASVIGNAGKKVQKFTRKLLEANLIHCIASNAHHSKRHGFFMRAALREIKKRFGDTTVYQLRKNSEALAADEPVYKEIPERIV